MNRVYPIAAALGFSLECPALPNNLHTRVFARASRLVGGPEKLAKRLGISKGLVNVWMAGKLTPPPDVFFKVVDIIHSPNPEAEIFTSTTGDVPVRGAKTSD